MFCYFPCVNCFVGEALASNVDVLVEVTLIFLGEKECLCVSVRKQSFCSWNNNANCKWIKGLYWPMYIYVF